LGAPWINGWSYFLQAAMQDDPLFEDTPSPGVPDPAPIDIEAPDPPVGTQDDEGSVAATLWDLLDPANEPWDAVDLPLSEIWSVVSSQQPTDLCAFHSALENARGADPDVDAIFLHHNVDCESSAPSAPDDTYNGECKDECSPCYGGCKPLSRQGDTRLGSTRQGTSTRNSNRQGGAISIYNGDKFEAAEDLRFPSPFRGDLTFERSYNSRLEQIGPLGYGWTHGFRASLITNYDSNPAYLKLLDETGRGVYFEEQATDEYRGRFGERSWVEKLTGGTTEYVWHRRDRRKFVFDATGQLTRIEDEVGNHQDLAYNASDLLETVTDVASGRVLTFDYSGGLLQSISGPVTAAVPTGIWVDFAYDGNDNLTSVTYADGSGFTYLYEDPDDPHNLTEKRDKAGHFLADWSYDSQDRATVSTTRDGQGVTVDYDTHAAAGKVDALDAYGESRLFAIGAAAGRKRVTAKEGVPCLDCGDDVVRMEYDADSRLTLKEYANGRIDLFQDFDGNGNPQTIVLASGSSQERTVSYTYSQENFMLSRVESSVLGAGNKETIWDYDDDYDAIPNENPTSLLSRKIERGYTRNSSGTLVPYEYITTYQYQPAPGPDDPSGLLASVDGPRPGSGDTTSYTYDAVTGDLASITRPEVGTTTYDNYDAAGNPTSITDVNGVPTSFTYDGRNRTLTTTVNGSFTRSTTYTTAGEIDQLMDETGRTLDFDYDTTYGRLQRVTDPAGNYLRYAYDSAGNRIEDHVLDASDTMRRYQRFDYQGDGTIQHPPGRLWKQIQRNHTDTADVEVVHAYDAMGNLQSLTDGNGNQTSYAYDLFNRLATATQPGSVVTQYGYDNQGNLTLVLNAENQETLYTYDDMGRLLTTVSPDTGTTRYSYDEADNLATKTPNNGITATYSYDDLNRLLQISYTDASQNIGYSYDAFVAGANYGIGRLTGIADTSGTTAYAYDVQGNLTSEAKTIDGSTYTTAYAYDGAGRIRGMTYPSGRTLTYVPDATDPTLVAEISTTFTDGTRTLADAIDYQPFGPLVALHFGNSIQLTQTYDLSYSVDTITAGAIQDLDYSLDDAGNIIAIADLIDPSKDRTFSYDDLYRLTGVNGETNYSYDDIGNRLTKTMGGESDTYHYYVDGSTQTNILESITGDNPQTYAHNANGDITAIGAMTLQYSPQSNRLISIPGTADYTYNANGQRVKKVVGAVTTIYHYDIAGNLIGETMNGGGTRRDYVYLGDQRVAMAVEYSGDLDGDNNIDGSDLALFASHFGPGCSGAACDSDFNGDGNVDKADLAVFADAFGHTASIEYYYYHNDHLGTPQRISNEGAGVVWAADYEAFGNLKITASNIPNNLRFPGQHYDDESNLNYNYFRDYDPQIGRYIQSDPMGLGGGLNTYVYVENRPTSLIDPSGLIPNVAELTCFVNPFQPVCWGGAAVDVTTTLLGIGAIGVGIVSLSGSTEVERCEDDERCPPCEPYPSGTVGYIGPHNDHDHYPIGRPHLNLFVVNQNPDTCQCYWNKNTPDAAKPPPLPGWKDLNGGFPPLSP
jgi:RHS repeat-associated protein